LTNEKLVSEKSPGDADDDACARGRIAGIFFELKRIYIYMYMFEDSRNECLAVQPRSSGPKESQGFKPGNERKQKESGESKSKHERLTKQKE
jgi:hypothetical protein